MWTEHQEWGNRTVFGPPASHSSSLSEPGGPFLFLPLLPLPLFGWAGEEKDAKNRRRETDLFFLSPVERTNDPSLTNDGAGKWWSSSHPAQFSLARFDLGSTFEKAEKTLVFFTNLRFRLRFHQGPKPQHQLRRIGAKLGQDAGGAALLPGTAAPHGG